MYDNLLQAKTSALFELESGILGSMTLPGKPVYGLEHSNNGLISFPGGVDLRLISHLPVYV